MFFTGDFVLFGFLGSLVYIHLKSKEDDFFSS